MTKHLICFSAYLKFSNDPTILSRASTLFFVNKVEPLANEHIERGIIINNVLNIIVNKLGVNGNIEDFINILNINKKGKK